MIGLSGLTSKRRRANLPTTWTQQTSSFTGGTWIDWLYYGDGVWVACGDGGKLATSTDGESWTQRTSGFSTSTIRGGCYGGGVYVNVGSDGKLFTASDATSTWTSRTSAYGSAVIYGVSYDGSTYFVSVGEGIRLATATDPEGTWTSRSGNITSGGGIYAAEYNGSNLWVVGGNSLSGDTIVNTASDPTGSWVLRTVVSSNAGIIYGVAYGNSIWVVVGVNAASQGKIWSATNPTSTWVERSHPFGTDWVMEVAYANGCFLACGAGGKMATSTDGISWNQVVDPSFSTTGIYGLAYDGTSRWVATGLDDKIAISDVTPI